MWHMIHRYNRYVGIFTFWCYRDCKWVGLVVLIVSCFKQLLIRSMASFLNIFALANLLLQAEGKLVFSKNDQTQQQVIANATTTCTIMMSSILVSLTSTCPRVNAENEHGIQRIVELLVFGNFFLIADKLILYHLLLRCYVDDSNTCSDSKFSTEGSPYNWSCQACRGKYHVLPNGHIEPQSNH